VKRFPEEYFPIREWVASGQPVISWRYGAAQYDGLM